MRMPILATTFIHVTLDENTLPQTVAVNVPDVVIRKPTRLVWLLTGNAARGSFPPPSDREHPAFDLPGSPPFGVFNNPQLSEKQFSLDDNHDGQLPDSEWPYHLWIKLGTKYYETATALAKSPKASSRKPKSPNAKGSRTMCPRIKNR